jgi:hypothetical protein
MSNIKVSEFPYENKSGFTPSDLFLMVNYLLPSGTTVNTTLTDLKEFILDGSVITGGSYNNGVYQFINNTGGTFNISATTTYSAGVISGGTWSSTGAGGINLPEVKVALFNNSENLEPIYVYTVPSGTTGVNGIPSLSNDDTNYIIIDYNGGSPKWDVSLTDSVINDSNIVLYMIVYRANTFVHTLDFGNQGAGLPNKINDRIIMTDRFARESGFSLGLSGGTGVVTLSAGVSWNGTYRQSLNQLNSQDDIFFQNYHLGGIWVYSTSANILNNQYYDNGISPVSSSPGKFLVNWYFRGQEINDHIYEVWGNDEYDNLSEAQLSPEPSLPELITSHAFLVGRIIVEYGALTGSVESAFTRYFQGSEVQSHNDLTGIQGGGPGEYYHLTSDEYNNLPLLNTNNNFQSGITANTVTVLNTTGTPNQAASFDSTGKLVAGLGQSTFSSFGTSTLTVTSAVTTFTLIPGLTQTITVPENCRVLITTDGGMNTTSTSPTAISTVDIAIFIDGSLIGNGAYRRISAFNPSATAINSTGIGWSLTTIQNLSAGSHTIDVRSIYVIGSSASVSSNNSNSRQGALYITIIKN